MRSRPVARRNKHLESSTRSSLRSQNARKPWIAGDRLLKLSDDFVRGFRLEDSGDGRFGMARLSANEVKQKIERFLLPRKSDGREQNRLRPVVTLRSEALAQGSESLGGPLIRNGPRGFRRRFVGTRQEASNPGNRRGAFDAQNAAVASAQHFGLVGGQNRPKAKQQRRGARPDLLDGASGVYANGRYLVYKEFHETVQQLGLRQTAALHQGQGARAAQCARCIFTASPHGLGLNMAYAAQENLGVLTLERGQRAADRVLRPALRISLDGIGEEAIEGCDEFRQQLGQTKFRRQVSGLGNDIVVAVSQRLAQRLNHRLRCLVFELVQSRELLIEAAFAGQSYASHQFQFHFLRIPCDRRSAFVA
jgi:hypothetical protein